MKNLCITSLAASLLVAAPAFAQHLKFEGLSLGVNLNFPSTTVDYSVGGISGNKSNATNDGGVQAAYKQPLCHIHATSPSFTGALYPA